MRLIRKKLRHISLFFVCSVGILSPLITWAQGIPTSTATTSTAAAAATSSDIRIPIPSQGRIRAAIDKETLNEGADAKSDTDDSSYESAVVLTEKTAAERSGDNTQQVTSYEVQITSGPFAGQTKTILNDISGGIASAAPRPGDHVIVYIENGGSGEPAMYLEGYDRRGALYALCALFVFVMFLLAGWQGLKVAFSIFLSIAIIGLVIIPAFLRGINPIPVAFLVTTILALISSGLSIGWNKKTLVTVIGTLGGAFVAYLISVIFGNWSHLSGLSTEEDRMFFDKNPLLDPHGLLFAGIIIAAMGVVEDVAVSIASGVMEVRQANPRLGFKELFRSGMVVGRDHMAALANTLIYAYVGSSLSLLLLYTQYGGSWTKFINFDGVTDEIIRSLSGTIGLVFTVPITALLAAWVALKIRQPSDPVRSAQGWRNETDAEHAGHGHHHHR